MTKSTSSCPLSDELIARVRADRNVVGVVHSGSRGRGFYVTEQSDWDYFIVVRELRGEYPSEHGDRIEYSEITLERLADPPAWARPALLSVDLLLDKTGEVAAALSTATTVDPATAGEPLDGYINMYYRSAKNARVGLELGSLLDAQESIPWFLQFVFNVHGRVRPYNKWLEWELREHPLPVEVDLERLRRIATTGDIAAQQSLFREAERLARDAGLAAVIDGWEPDVTWLRGE
jgi:predicted nucleotidyltransferase